jgi:hypothetical protein
LIKRLSSLKPGSKAAKASLTELNSKVTQLEQDVLTNATAISTFQEQQTALAGVVQVLAARVEILTIISGASLLVAIACLVYLLLK